MSWSLLKTPQQEASDVSDSVVRTSFAADQRMCRKNTDHLPIAHVPPDRSSNGDGGPIAPCASDANPTAPIGGFADPLGFYLMRRPNHPGSQRSGPGG